MIFPIFSFFRIFFLEINIFSKIFYIFLFIFFLKLLMFLNLSLILNYEEI